VWPFYLGPEDHHHGLLVVRGTYANADLRGACRG
jgi:hypothetical protein